MRLLLAVLALLFAAPAFAAEVDTGHLKIELVAQDASVAPGTTAYVALRQDIDAGWHTYWRNPGDSGEPPKLTWTLPAGWTAGEFVWATPKTLPFGPLTNYGYSGEVILPVPIAVPANARPGPVTLEAVVDVLVCEKICIPETGKVSVTLTVADGAPKPDARWGASVAAALAAAPKPAGLTATFENGKTLTLAVAGAPLKGADMSGAWFFPFQGVWIDHAKAQTAERGSDGLTLTLTPGYAFESGKPPAVMDGVLVVGDKAYEISATPGPAPAGVSGLGPPPGAKGEGTGAAPKTGLLIAALTAFLGGLILNLMPCVFPVLSMKAASLARHAHETRAARRQGLAYGAGVVATFLILAGVLIGLQLAGQQVGWGFQLQSPPVVGVLGLLMLAVALNMSGVFEIGTSVQGVGSGLAAKGGLSGAFFTGVLAVVVASPCTAPFMAGALGFTIGQPPIVVLAVFLALSLGFAAPFVALAFAPGLLRRLPKPGAWMDTLRKVLAFPMYGAAAWLLWVLSQQTDAAGLAVALMGLLTGAFALWLWGLGPKAWRQGLALLLLAGAVALVLQPDSAAPRTGESAASAVLPSEAWSEERVAALRAEGKVVFVNFTAAWCVSCQVNDKVALSTDEVAKALTAANGVYLKADWTNRNPEIAAALAEHGRAGVPLYLVYGPASETPQVLPQLLTPGMVAGALKKAAGT
ncbi:thioredoxin family protein [Caulobacter sp. NIBR1757]|uniref:protein-disulfide reductase DsbD family protein n=1 Tax=Caulobacter sp. NIBR1757 TaxID=3016000 RepID=UPI0022F05C63|nr:thioredoxin family protein [Caulobacter sp. NIBR1757]WGM37813.1 Thiol:disulfide interchange protein DsbD [Caulobacter sp. NIBR1757]